jgi:hypothetical protein
VTYAVVLVVCSFFISLVSLALTLTLYEKSKTEENDQWRNTFYDTFLLGLAYFCWISKFSKLRLFFLLNFLIFSSLHKAVVSSCWVSLPLIVSLFYDTQ